MYLELLAHPGLLLLRGHSPFPKTSSSPLLPILLLTKFSASAAMGDPRKFQSLPFPADIKATTKTLHVPLGFGNNFPANSAFLHISGIHFQTLWLLVNCAPMILGGKYTQRHKSLSAPSSQQSLQTTKHCKTRMWGQSLKWKQSKGSNRA